MLRTLGCCARITSVLVVSSSSVCFAQQPVVTLGTPAAKSSHSASTATQIADPLNTAFDQRNEVVPKIQVNRYVPSQIDAARQSVEELVRGDQAESADTVWPQLQSTVSVPDHKPSSSEDAAPTNDALVGTPGIFLSAFAPPTPPTPSTPSTVTARPIAVPPRMSVTPAEPKLSPTIWVHQPMVARQVGKDDLLDNATNQSSGLDVDEQPLLDRESLVPTEPVVVSPDPAMSPDTFPEPATSIRPLTEIRRAAMRQRATRTVETSIAPAQTEPIRPGYSIEALRNTAMELIAEAQLKLDIRAYMSAEEKAKKALELIAQSIDTREQSSFATRDLMISLTAIREAEDFVGKYGMVDGDAITRMVRSHATEILKPYDTTNLNGLAAADVYLDWSRRCIVPLAVADPLAAEAIRILAQSHRLRDDGTPFGLATSVHLIRAAAEGAPDNQQVRTDYETTLQVAGLAGQSRIAQVGKIDRGGQSDGMVSQVAGDWQSTPTLQTSSVTTLDGQPKREVKIVEVSPEQFAAISPSAAGPPGTPYAQPMLVNHQHAAQSNQQNNRQSGTYRPDHVNQSVARHAEIYPSSPHHSAPLQGSENSVKGRLSRAFNPITRHLR